ncbi:MAG: acyl-CoA dehydrogenase family protein, partial [Novosphingobium sp.]
MPTYQAPTRDMQFIVNELLELSNQTHLAGMEDVSSDLADSLIEESGKFASEVIAPLNQSGDRQGAIHHPDGSVTLPDGFKEAYNALREAGWSTLVQPQRYGGQGLPHALGMAVDEFLSGANQAFAMLPGLTVGAAAAISATGSDQLKDLYLPRLISGQWSGTMNLTEPQCGTDLGLIRTKAEPQADGTCTITGTMIFISGGEHDATENIILLVLAKTPG